MQISATNPAKIYGLYPRKGTIQIGSDADLVIWDATKSWTISIDRLHDGMDYTPYEGLEVAGWPETTISRGVIIWHDAKFVGAPGRGQFLSCDKSQEMPERDVLDSL